MAKKKTKKKPRKKQRPIPPAKIVAEKPPVTISDKKITTYPTADRKITEFEKTLDEQLAGEPAQPGRTRGRPRKEEQPEPEFAMTENLIAEGLKTPFELWAITQRLNELKLQDKEAVMLAAPVKQLLDHYLPNVPMIAIAWASLAITTKSIMAPRLALIAEIKKQKVVASAQPDDKDEGQGGPRPAASPAGGGGPVKIGFPKATKPVQI